MPGPKEVIKGGYTVKATDEETVGSLARIRGRPFVDADLARLKALNNEVVTLCVSRGERLPGTGLMRGVATNMVNLYKDEKTMTCGDQAVLLLDLISKKYGGKIGADWAGITTVTVPDGWRYKMGTSWPNHAFVEAIGPKGQRYRVDPWYGEVWRLPAVPYPSVLGTVRG